MTTHEKTISSLLNQKTTQENYLSAQFQVVLEELTAYKSAKNSDLGVDNFTSKIVTSFVDSLMLKKQNATLKIAEINAVIADLND